MRSVCFFLVFVWSQTTTIHSFVIPTNNYRLSTPAHSWISSSSSSSSSTTIVASSSVSSSSNQQQPPLPSSSRRDPPTPTKHLHRHFDDISMDCYIRTIDTVDFWMSCGLTREEIDTRLLKLYPDILTIDVHDQLAPKLRFFIQTLKGGTGTLNWVQAAKQEEVEEDEECVVAVTSEEEEEEQHNLQLGTLGKEILLYSKDSKTILEYYFNKHLNLDRSLGPKHAFLEYHDLPHGKTLLKLQNGELFQELLAICNAKNLQQSNKKFISFAIQLATRSIRPMGGSISNTIEFNNNIYSIDHYNEFDIRFRKGLYYAIVEYPSKKEESPKDYQRFMQILLSHGANYKEYDSNYGIPLLHWAAGYNNFIAFEELMQTQSGCNISDDDNCPSNIMLEDLILYNQDPLQGCNPLHYACLGLSLTSGFGTHGGHYEMVQKILEICGGNDKNDDNNDFVKSLIDSKTWSNNTPLMFAAFVGNLNIIELLLQTYREEETNNNQELLVTENSKGNTLAHFAVLSGNLKVCQYIKEQFDAIDSTMGVEYFKNKRNQSNQLPIDYAQTLVSLNNNNNNNGSTTKEYKEIIEWIHSMSSSDDAATIKTVDSNDNNDNAIPTSILAELDIPILPTLQE